MPLLLNLLAQVLAPACPGLASSGTANTPFRRIEFSGLGSGLRSGTSRPQPTECYCATRRRKGPNLTRADSKSQPRKIITRSDQHYLRSMVGKMRLSLSWVPYAPGAARVLVGRSYAGDTRQNGHGLSIAYTLLVYLCLLPMFIHGPIVIMLAITPKYTLPKQA